MPAHTGRVSSWLLCATDESQVRLDSWAPPCQSLGGAGDDELESRVWD
jgi:hypothetical protein